MVDLTNPTPPNPIQGHEFSITATSGVAPYQFVWRVDDGENTTENQTNPTLTIDVPGSSAGDDLIISVTDGRQDQDIRTWIILVEGKEP